MFSRAVLDTCCNLIDLHSVSHMNLHCLDSTRGVGVMKRVGGNMESPLQPSVLSHLTQSEQWPSYSCHGFPLGSVTRPTQTSPPFSSQGGLQSNADQCVDILKWLCVLFTLFAGQIMKIHCMQRLCHPEKRIMPIATISLCNEASYSDSTNSFTWSEFSYGLSSVLIETLIKLRRASFA